MVMTIFGSYITENSFANEADKKAKNATTLFLHSNQYGYSFALKPLPLTNNMDTGKIIVPQGKDYFRKILGIQLVYCF